jgi:hypothetical protein
MEGTKMIKKFICGLVALGSFGFLLHAADDASVGTWKLNEAKSKFAKGQEEKDYTIVVTVAGDTRTVSVNGIGGFYGPGKPMSFKFTVPLAGGPLNYSENPPPAGLTDVMKKIDDRTSDIISTMNGKQIAMEHIVISPDNKTMVIKVSGVDSQTGQAFKNVEVYDRQ